MRYACAVVVIAVAAGFASEAQATPVGQGGYIYWSKLVGTATVDMHYEIWQQTVDTSWAAVGSPVNVDCVSFSTTSTYQFSQQWFSGNSLEVLDPRDQGGTGQLLQPAIYNRSWVTASNNKQAWDIVKVDPVTHAKVLLDEGMLYTNDTTPNTAGLLHAVVAPQNWVAGTTSNGLSLATASFVSGSGMASVNYLYDTNINHVLDNNTTEAKQRLNLTTDSAACVSDMEFAGKVLYASVENRSGLGPYKLYRIWQDSAGVSHNDIFAQSSYAVGTATNPICGGAGHQGTYGVAINTHTASPIVYWLGYDNVNTGTPSAPVYQQYATVFALRDTNGDNVADAVSELWRSGTFSISLATGGYGSGDVEFYADPKTGATTLVCSGEVSTAGSVKTFALELSDNGLVALSAVSICTSSASFTSSSSLVGVELDMNPYTSSVPEPMTALLLGSGALGLVGYIRRQRMR